MSDQDCVGTRPRHPEAERGRRVGDRLAGAEDRHGRAERTARSIEGEDVNLIGREKTPPQVI